MKRALKELGWTPLPSTGGFLTMKSLCPRVGGGRLDGEHISLLVLALRPEQEAGGPGA